MRAALLWLALGAMVTGCSTSGGGAAYLSLSDMEVVISKKGEWIGPYAVHIFDAEAAGKRIFSGKVRRGIGVGIPHEIRELEGNEGAAVVLKDGSGQVFRVDGPGGRELVETLKFKGRSEIFPEGIRERMGLGGLGI